MCEKLEFISVKIFRAEGYLQELNRQFLHPLGLAIEINIDNDTGVESFGRIWDCRKDTEGLRYAESVLSDPEFQKRRQQIELLQVARGCKIKASR